MDKTLIMMVGLPRSGKTTKALELARRHHAPIVSPDAIRLSLHGQAFIKGAEPFVWAVAHTMVESLFKLHDHVIFDACNSTRVRRAEWKSKAWKREFVEIDTALGICIARAGNNPELIAAINRMAEKKEPVSETELY